MIPLNVAYQIGAKLCDKLSAATMRAVLAGSIERKKPEVKDIEIVAIPEYINGLSGEPNQSKLDILLSEWGVKLDKNGPRQKSFTFNGRSGRVYPVDLFLADNDNFGYIRMIRTGPKEFSQWAVTPRSQGGALPDHLKASGGYIWDGDERIHIPNEFEMFFVLGIKWIRPEKRTADVWNRQEELLNWKQLRA